MSLFKRFDVSGTGVLSATTFLSLLLLLTFPAFAAMEAVEFERVGAGGQTDGNSGLREFDYLPFQPIANTVHSSADYDAYPVMDVVSGVSSPTAEAAVYLGGQSLADGIGNVDFDRHLIDGAAPALTFEVRNLGAADLSTSNLTVPAGYAVTEPLDALIPGAGSDTFTVALDTAVSGTFGGTIQFDNNDADENPFSFNVTGRVYELIANDENLRLGFGGQTDIGSMHREYDILPMTPLGAIYDSNAEFLPHIAVEFDAASIAAGGSLPSLGRFQVNSAGPVFEFTVSNTGFAALEIASLDIPAGYTLGEGLDASIAPGLSDTFSIVLDTSTPGFIGGSIQIGSNDPEDAAFGFDIVASVFEPIVPPEYTMLGIGGQTDPASPNRDYDIVPLTPWGTTAVSRVDFRPEIAIDKDGAAIVSGPGAAVDLGYGFEGAAAPQYVFTVRNEGKAILTANVTNVPAGYSLIKNLGASIAPGGSDTFIIQLDTSTTGVFSGTVRLNTNDADEASYVFTIIARVYKKTAAEDWNSYQ